MDTPLPLWVYWVVTIHTLLPSRPLFTLYVASSLRLPHAAAAIYLTFVVLPCVATPLYLPFMPPLKDTALTILRGTRTPPTGRCVILLLPLILQLPDVVYPCPCRHYHTLPRPPHYLPGRLVLRYSSAPYSLRCRCPTNVYCPDTVVTVPHCHTGHQRSYRPQPGGVPSGALPTRYLPWLAFCQFPVDLRAFTYHGGTALHSYHLRSSPVLPGWTAIHY